MELAKEMEKKGAMINKILIRTIIAVIVSLLVLGSAVSVYLYQQGIKPVSSVKDKVLVKVPAGSSTAEVSQLLYQKGLINSELAFRIYSRINGLDGQLKAGEYELAPNMAPKDILAKMKKGDVFTISVTIPEGYTTKQIADVLAAKRLINRERFMDMVANGSFKYDFLAGAPTGERRLEGFLFPDTYHIEKGAKEEDIINMMLKQFQQEMTPDLVNKAKSLNMSVRQVVTLASMIEKEAKAPEDRPMVSAVFHNRLKKNMKLGSDVTVLYVIDKPNKTTLTYKDTAIDSPYNTYKYPGLPIGPIASPGKSTILAALNPADVKYLYFIAKPDGSLVFTSTSAEHDAAIKKYLR